MGKYLYTAFMVLYLYNVTYDTYYILKHSNGYNDDKVKRKANLLDACVALLSGLTFLFIIINLLKQYNLTGQYYLIPVILISLGLNTERPIRIIDSVKHIIVDNSLSREILPNERRNFNIIVNVILVLSIFFKKEIIIKWLKYSIKSTISLEIMISLCGLISIFLFSFLVIVELIAPLHHFEIVIIHLANILSEKINYVMKYVGFFCSRAEMGAVLTNKVKGRVRGKVLLVRCFMYILCIGTLLIDLLINISIIAAYLVGVMGIGTVIKIVELILKVIWRIIKKITTIPSTRIVANAFRISTIISVFYVAIVNRLRIDFVYTDSYIAISEFVASAIIIPIILEWIYSGKKQTGFNNNDMHN